jgi:putative ABC transport system permease protein
MAILLPLGCVLTLPLLLPILLPVTARLLGAILGTTGRLAFRQLDRQRTRTAVTAGVLAISLIVNIGFGNALLSSVRDIHNWIDHQAIADFFIRGTHPDAAYTVTVSALPESIATEIAAQEGVARVDYLNWIPLRVAGHSAVVLACTLPPNQPLPILLIEGEPAAVRRGLEQGATVVGTALAKRLGVGVGDSVAIDTPRGQQSILVVGTMNEYTLDGMALVFEWETARRLFAIQGVHVLSVTAATRGDATVAERLRAFCGERGLIFQSQAGLQAYIDDMLRGLTVSLWGLLVLLGVVASLGIVNTLTMNILEQTRELGVLRAIGMLRGQIRRMIVAQAIAIALLSLVPGILAGFATAYFCTQLERHVLAHEMPFYPYFGYTGACVAGAVLVALLAALLPARSAANLQIIRALHYE